MKNKNIIGGQLELTSCKKLFLRKKLAQAMNYVLNSSNLLFSERFAMIDDKMNIQGDNLVEYCI
jgi:hypothetical protein